jgi:hypothetical protein
MVIYFRSDFISEKVNNTHEKSRYSQKPSAAVMEQKFYYAQRTATTDSQIELEKSLTGMQEIIPLSQGL